jgi:hypothetical protein
MTYSSNEELVRRIAGRIFRILAIRSQARYNALVAAGMSAIENESFDPSGQTSFLKDRIHFAMFETIRRFETDTELNEHPTAA